MKRLTLMRTIAGTRLRSRSLLRRAASRATVNSGRSGEMRVERFEAIERALRIEEPLKCG